MLRSQMLRGYILGHGDLLLARNRVVEYCMETMEEEGHSCLIYVLGVTFGIIGNI